MNSGFWRRKISYILKEKCSEVGARRGECSDKLFYMIGLGKSLGMSGVPLFSLFSLFSGDGPVRSLLTPVPIRGTIS